jgi:arsenate reductase
MAIETKPAPRRVLFVCIGNSCRSQMAEALAKQFASDVIQPSSAGLSPLGRIADTTRRVLLERGVSVDGQHSKGLGEANPSVAELIVNLTGIPGEKLFPFPQAEVEDWEVGDPYGEDLEIYRRVCDEIEERLKELAERLRGKPAAAPPR